MRYAAEQKLQSADAQLVNFVSRLLPCQILQVFDLILCKMYRNFLLVFHYLFFVCGKLFQPFLFRQVWLSCILQTDHQLQICSWQKKVKKASKKLAYELLTIQHWKEKKKKSTNKWLLSYINHILAVLQSKCYLYRRYSPGDFAIF